MNRYPGLVTGQEFVKFSDITPLIDALRLTLPILDAFEDEAESIGVVPVNTNAAFHVREALKLVQS